MAVIPNPPPGSGAPRPGGAGIFDRIVEQAQNRSEEGPPPTRSGGGTQRVITMYRNGFIVDDGPFRNISAPENQAFVKALEAGNVPAGKRSVPLLFLYPYYSLLYHLLTSSIYFLFQKCLRDFQVISKFL